MLERYSIFNKGNAEETHLQVNEDFVNKLVHTLEVDPNKYEQLETEVSRNKEYILKQDSEIEVLEESITVSEYIC